MKILIIGFLVLFCWSALSTYIYVCRLWIAHKHEANNLTLIDGLGLWVKERLNLLEIYTFDQISKLTHEDIETITEVLEIIPGRIEKNDWVNQAHELTKKLHKN